MPLRFPDPPGPCHDAPARRSSRSPGSRLPGRLSRSPLHWRTTLCALALAERARFTWSGAGDVWEALAVEPDAAVEAEEDAG